jgi:hypothetical protein
MQHATHSRGAGCGSPTLQHCMHHACNCLTKPAFESHGNQVLHANAQLAAVHRPTCMHACLLRLPRALHSAGAGSPALARLPFRAPAPVCIGPSPEHTSNLIHAPGRAINLREAANLSAAGCTVDGWHSWACCCWSCLPRTTNGKMWTATAPGTTTTASSSSCQRCCVAGLFTPCVSQQHSAAQGVLCMHFMSLMASRVTQ